jgi:hypothetical protein
MKLKRMLMEAAVAYLLDYPDIYFQRLKKPTEISVRTDDVPMNSNCAPPEYKSVTAKPGVS